MTYGPNHRHVEGRLYSGHYSGEGYNRVRVCSCGAEDHDPEPASIDRLMTNILPHGHFYSGRSYSEVKPCADS